jgi:DNA-binding PadR family transcriptional regulator
MDILGNFEQAVLLAIVRLQEDAYGRGILREVQERLKRDIAAGAVHATLERLEGRGLITSHLGVGTPIRDGRARRFYRLEPAGVEALNDARAALMKLWQGIRWPLKGYVWQMTRKAPRDGLKLCYVCFSGQMKQRLNLVICLKRIEIQSIPSEDARVRIFGTYVKLWVTSCGPV